MTAQVMLTVDDVRRAALHAQGLLGSAYALSAASARRASLDARRTAVHSVLQGLGAVQLDTISVLARSHELVAYARLGAIGRDAVESAYWDGESSFEYWSHAACILPTAAWPWFEFRRRTMRARGVRWHDVPTSALAGIRERLQREGPLTATELGGAKAGGAWWDWSETKVGVEWLLDIGEVVVTRRVGWRRVYDLAERAIPDELLSQLPDDEQCLRYLIAQSAQRMGVGTAADIADVHRLPSTQVTRLASDAGLVPVSVHGWRERAWASPESLTWLESGDAPRHRTTLLSPFDSLIWHRGRTERIFGLTHRLEAYTPAPRRIHGYFAMPVLHGGRLVARVDPAREKPSVLVARRVTMETDGAGAPVRGALEGTARALQEAARWISAESIRVDEVRPASATRDLRRAVAG